MGMLGALTRLGMLLRSLSERKGYHLYTLIQYMKLTYHVSFSLKCNPVKGSMKLKHVAQQAQVAFLRETRLKANSLNE